MLSDIKPVHTHTNRHTHLLKHSNHVCAGAGTHFSMTTHSRIICFSNQIWKTNVCTIMWVETSRQSRVSSTDDRDASQVYQLKFHCKNVDCKRNTNPEQQTDTLNWTICLCVSFNTYVSLRLNYFFHLVGFNVWIHKMHRVLSQSSGPEPLGCDSKLQKEWQAFLK